MKKRIPIFIIIGVLLAILITVATVLLDDITADSEAPTHPTVANADSIYDNAISAIGGVKNLSLQISYKKEVITQTQTLTQHSVQHIAYEGLGTPLLRARTEESLTVGPHEVDISEVFIDNTLYLTIDGSKFRSVMDADAYLMRYVPVQTLHAALYNTITGEDTGDGHIIYFSDPTAVEPWVQSESDTCNLTWGTAHINTAGQLTKSTYTTTYSTENGYIRIFVVVDVDYTEQAVITAPESTTTYTELDHPDALKTLEIASGYLLASNPIQSICEDIIFCEAFGDTRSKSVTLKTSSNDPWSAEIDTEIEIINSSKAGAGSTYTQKETFANNTYASSVNGASAEPNGDIDISAMQSYCQDLLVGTIILPKYITGISIDDNDTHYTITFTGNETFARLMDAEACNTLYTDADILRNTAQSTNTVAMRCYLTINKQTGLPSQSGFDYQGVYTIDELPYLLQFKSDQQYILP